MADLKLGAATGDLVITAQDVELVYDDDGIRQRLKTRLEDVRGEWFRDTTIGTDWYGKILGKKPDNVRRAEFRRVIVGTEDIVGLDNLELTLTGTTRRLDVVFGAILDDGRILDVRFDNILGST